MIIRQPRTIQFICLSSVMLCIVVSACVPIRSTFYRPDPQSLGRVTNYQCYQAGGAPNALMFTRDNVQFMISVFSQEPPVDGEFTTTLQVRVPHDRFVQMNPDEVKVTDEQGRTISLYSVTTVFDEGANDTSNKQRKLSLPIYGLNGDVFPGSKYDAVYHVWSIIKAPLPDYLFVDIPSMHVGGAGYEAFRIGFRKTHGRYLQPINGC